MSIKDDILGLAQFEEDYFKIHGRYLQGLPTPEEIPTEGSISNITELRKPSDESEKIPFTPTAKDYQVRVDVWSRLEGKKETHGFVVTAKRDLVNGITEIVTTEDKSLG